MWFSRKKNVVWKFEILILKIKAIPYSIPSFFTAIPKHLGLNLKGPPWSDPFLYRFLYIMEPTHTLWPGNMTSNQIFWAFKTKTKTKKRFLNKTKQKKKQKKKTKKFKNMGWERLELSTSGSLRSYETYALANCATTPGVILCAMF